MPWTKHQSHLHRPAQNASDGRSVKIVLLVRIWSLVFSGLLWAIPLGQDPRPRRHAQNRYGGNWPKLLIHFYRNSPKKNSTSRPEESIQNCYEKSGDFKDSCVHGHGFCKLRRETAAHLILIRRWNCPPIQMVHEHVRIYVVVMGP